MEVDILGMAAEKYKPHGRERCRQSHYEVMEKEEEDVAM